LPWNHVIGLGLAGPQQRPLRRFHRRNRFTIHLAWKGYGILRKGTVYRDYVIHPTRDSSRFLHSSFTLSIVQYFRHAIGLSKLVHPASSSLNISQGAQ
jgi:hypothetical protein